MALRGWDIVGQVQEGLRFLSGDGYISQQIWQNVGFFHWRVPKAALRDLVPRELDIEEFDGTAWISVVPIQMRGGRMRFLPPVPGLAELSEINVRTYVRTGGRSGVWFFSLDSTSRLASWVGKSLLGLPFFHARGGVTQGADGTLSCEMRRVAAGGGDFVARYRPVGGIYYARPGSLDEFLAERYYAFTRDPFGRLQHGIVAHEPWPLQRAEVTITVNTLAAAAGLTLPGAAPEAHFSHQVHAQAYPPRAVS